MTVEIVPADRFTIQELTDLYNQTRVDYLVPMPMNAERLGEYIHDFDVNIQRSGVARDINGQTLGLGMLGIRGEIGWVTRLGVLPSTRRTGAGLALMDHLMKNAEEAGAKEIHLEVIKDNEPAYKLFLKKGFFETGKYFVMRRAPHPTTTPLYGDVEWLDSERVFEKLGTYPGHLTWINAVKSMCNSTNTEGLHIRLPNGASGWLVYRNAKFTLRSTISHLVMHTEQGDPHRVGAQLLARLHTRYPHHDTYVENIHEHDPHLSAFHALEYFTNFARIEMRRR